MNHLNPVTVTEVGGVIIAFVLVMLLYSTGLQKRAVGTQEKAVRDQQEAIARMIRSLELQEETVALLREISAKIDRT